MSWRELKRTQKGLASPRTKKMKVFVFFATQKEMKFEKNAHHIVILMRWN